MWHTYYTPASVDDVLSLLAQHQAEARLIAGATDLLLEIERGVRAPRVLIDISRIGGLDEITLDEHDRIHLGPLVTHNHVVGSSLCVERAFPLARACWEVGSPQIRNRGTLAGNLITASPANDTITPLWAMDATVTLRSTRGTRTLTFGQFYQGVRRVDLAPDEMLVDIAFAALAPDERGTFIKLALRQAQAISVVNVAVVITQAGERVTRARIALGSVAPTIVRAPEAEAFLAGRTLDEASLAEAARLAAEAARPIDDIRGTAAYRRETVRVCTRRALRRLAAGEERADWPAAPVMLWGAGDGRFAERLRSTTMIHTVTDLGGAAAPGTEPERPIETTVNGHSFSIRGAAGKTLLRMLREDAGLIGTKEGCAEGECGACTVFLDGVAVMACLVPAPRAHGAKIETIEGLARTTDSGVVQLHPVQQAFVDLGAVQCGYCTPGFVMAGAKLLEEHPRPSEWEIKQGLTGNLCRCTGYYKIVAAIERAAARPAAAEGETKA